MCQTSAEKISLSSRACFLVVAGLLLVSNVGIIICTYSLGLWNGPSEFVYITTLATNARLRFVSQPDSTASEVQEPRILVTYVYSNTDKFYLDNLRFFVEHGIPGCLDCTFIIIVNEDAKHPVRNTPLP